MPTTAAVRRSNEAKAEVIAPVSNEGAEDIVTAAPYIARVSIRGTAPIIFHSWNNEAVREKAAGAKNSKVKKTDNVESYVVRDEQGNIVIPGIYLAASIRDAGRYHQDPRSTRASQVNLLKAAIVPLTDGVLGKHWDFLDARRVVVQRNAITRERPCFRPGWETTIDLMVLLPEYISPEYLLSLIAEAGRVVGMADYRPTFGRYGVSGFKVVTGAG